MKKTCVACGSPLLPEDRVCANCGEVVEQSAALVGEVDSSRPISDASTQIPVTESSAVRKFCPSCGNEVSEKQNFCDKCGENLSSQGSSRERLKSERKRPIPAQPSRNASVKKQPAKNKDANAGKLVTIRVRQWQLLSAAFLAVAVLVVFIVMNEKKSTDQHRGETPSQVNPTIEKDLETLKAAVESHPDDPQSWLRYANALHDSGHMTDAVAAYLRYLQSEPGNTDARIDLGVCYFELKRFDDAIAEMQRAVAQRPDHQRGNFNLGIVNLNAGRKSEALSWFQKTVAIDSTNEIGQKASQIIRDNL